MCEVCREREAQARENLEAMEEERQHCFICNTELPAEPVVCVECEVPVCGGCSGTLRNGNLICDHCSFSCDSCGRRTANCDQTECYSCGCSLCDRCYYSSEYDERYRCSSCHDSHCEDMAESDDYDSDDCGISLDEFSCDPHILDYNAEPESWKMVKQPWENTTYLGVELEMTFPSTNQNTIFSKVVNHLRGKHIWKYDGSISSEDYPHGAELVTTPMTLQSWHKVDTRAMLREISDLGANSYHAKTCGLHIHVSRNSIKDKDLKKIRQFFVTNKKKLLKFSQRNADTLSRWANIPDTNTPSEWYGKYVAVNEHGKSIEFRFFRGTLDYTRFKACLEFADCIVEYIKNHGVAHVRLDKSWDSFKEFAKRRNYRLLTKYITKRGL